MGTIFVDTLEPQSGTNLTLGASGDTIGLATGASQTLAVNTPAFLVYRNSTQSISSATYTKVQFNAEDVDTDSAYDTTTNYRFTVPSGKAGKYFIFTTVEGSAVSASQFKYQNVAIYKNGSVYINHIMHMENNNTQQGHGNTYAIMDLVAGDYLEVYSRVADSSGSPQFNGGNARQSCFGGYRMIGA